MCVSCGKNSLILMLMSVNGRVPFNPVKVKRSELICDVCSFLILIFTEITNRVSAELDRVTDKGTCLRAKVEVEEEDALSSFPGSS